MPGDCVVSTDNITVVRKALLTRHITTLGPERMSEVCRALAYATSC
jgi:mRNA-degrading endonuclease toxin of MazEF toxin-antitoxin module